MSPAALAAAVTLYFVLMLVVARRTSRGADEAAFFIGNRRSAWLLVSVGMIGTSLSGVTFVSVPGSVGLTSWHYLQVVIGQLFGYAIVALVLLPLYYRMQLSSIYGYLERRLGGVACRTGAGFFILSRTLGATARLYLVVRILQDVAFASIGVPFWATTLVIVSMIVLYTIDAGVRTIVWTDLLQTAGMLAGLAACSAFLLGALDATPLQALDAARSAGLATLWASDPQRAEFWPKQLVGGALIALTMTGLDQEMMQKNISVRTLRGAQINMLVMSVAMLVVVVAFLFLGSLLHLFAAAHGIAEQGDRLLPAVVTDRMPAAMQLVFVIALISALFPSADGALTALTTSLCLDVLRLHERPRWSPARRVHVRKAVHLGFALVFGGLVLGFRALDDPSMIALILKIATYTYGPLLGLFAFGILTRRALRVPWAAPASAVAAPLLCLAAEGWLAVRPDGYRVGLEMLLFNGALTFAGLWLGSRPREARA